MTFIDEILWNSPESLGQASVQILVSVDRRNILHNDIFSEHKENYYQSQCQNINMSKQFKNFDKGCPEIIE